MSELFNEYQKICKKYDKLLDDYSNVLSKLKHCRRQLYNKNKEAINCIRLEIRDSMKPDINLNSSYFCPYIRDYCMYVGSDFCLHICNERRV